MSFLADRQMRTHTHRVSMAFRRDPSNPSSRIPKRR